MAVLDIIWGVGVTKWRARARCGDMRPPARRQARHCSAQLQPAVTLLHTAEYMWGQ